MSFTEHDVRECRRLMIGCRTGQLAIGDILAGEWAEGAALGEFCERVGLSVTTAREWRATAAAVTPQLRQYLKDSGVFVSYSVLREGVRQRGGQALDPGYVKLLHLIEDARRAGVDRVNRATYQTVLGTAPPLAAVMDPQAHDGDDGIIDYVTEVHHSPNRDELVQVLVAEEQVTRAELAAAFDKRRTQQAQRQAQRRAQTQSAQPGAGTGAALVAGFAALAEQSARLAKRFPGQVTLDSTQQADAAVALDDLDVFMTWARQVSAVRPVAAGASARRSRRQTVGT